MSLEHLPDRFNGTIKCDLCPGGSDAIYVPERDQFICSGDRAILARLAATEGD